MRKRGLVATGAILAATMCGLPLTGPASASTAAPGVTATTIHIGVPYVDFSVLGKVGVNLNDGNTPDAFNALIANMNAHGGIDGRRIIAYLIAVDPTSPAPAATACTQLTEDDKIFLAIGPLMPDCYLTHDVPTIGAILPDAASFGKVPNFGLVPPADAYDPLQLSVFAKLGVFKGKKVGLFAGTTTDAQELKIVASALSKLHVDVIQTAQDSAPQNDLVALNAQVAVIAQRFKGAGVNEVVAVGEGSSVWPEAQSANQSTYNPPFVATNSGDLTGYTGGSNDPTYIKNVVVSTPLVQPYETWENPAIQKCVGIIRKAYPSDEISTPPKVATHSSDETYLAPEAACESLALFATIAKATGRDLTVSKFIRAGESLRNILLPGLSTPISFAPGRPYALGPVYLGHYNVTTRTIDYSNTSASK